MSDLDRIKLRRTRLGDNNAFLWFLVMASISVLAWLIWSAPSTVVQ